MSEHLKQLKIKTSMLKRLRKEYESYAKQTKSIATKIEGLQEKEQTQDIHYQLKKNVNFILTQRQFLEQSQSVLSNVKQKLIEAFEGLTNFISQKGENQNIKGSQQLTAAEDLVLEIETFLESI